MMPFLTIVLALACAVGVPEVASTDNAAVVSQIGLGDSAGISQQGDLDQTYIITQTSYFGRNNVIVYQDSSNNFASQRQGGNDNIVGGSEPGQIRRGNNYSSVVQRSTGNRVSWGQDRYDVRRHAELYQEDTYNPMPNKYTSLKDRFHFVSYLI